MSKKIFVVVLLFSLVLASCSDKKYDEAVEKGKENFEKENFEESQKYFEKALEIKEEDTTSKDYIEEIEDIKNQINEFEKSYNEAKNLGDEDKYNEAISEIEDTSGEDYSTEKLKTLKEDLNELKEDLKEDREKHVDEIEAVYSEAEKLGESKDYQKGKEIIEETLEDESNKQYLDESFESDLEDLYSQLKSDEKENAESPSTSDMLDNKEKYDGDYVKIAGDITQILEDDNDEVERVLTKSYRDPDSSDRSPHNKDDIVSIEVSSDDNLSKSELEGDPGNSKEIYFYGYVEGTYNYTNKKGDKREVPNIYIDEIDYIKDPD